MTTPQKYKYVAFKNNIRITKYVNKMCNKTLIWLIPTDMTAVSVLANGTFTIKISLCQL